MAGVPPAVGISAPVPLLASRPRTAAQNDLRGRGPARSANGHIRPACTVGGRVLRVAVTSSSQKAPEPCNFTPELLECQVLQPPRGHDAGTAQERLDPVRGLELRALLLGAANPGADKGPHPWCYTEQDISLATSGAGTEPDSRLHGRRPPHSESQRALKSPRRRVPSVRIIALSSRSRPGAGTSKPG